MALLLCAVISAGCSQAPPKLIHVTGSVQLMDDRMVVHGQAYLAFNRALQNITRVAEREVKFALISNMSPNAFVRENAGTAELGMHLGMVELIGQMEAEYAYVFAHELAHLSLEHLRHRAEQREESGKVSDLLAMLLGLLGIPIGALAIDSGAGLVSLGFDRDQEREADREGLRLLQAAGYPAEAALRFHRKMIPYESSAPEFLSTHPSGEERLENLQQMVEQSVN
jgi:predicted Zn-dependent protease